jgi:hypothetical protein
MGNFLAVSAFKQDDVVEVREAITEYCKAYGVSCRLRQNAVAPSERCDVAIYAPVAGWVRVLWPVYFNIHDFSLCQKLSSQNGWEISTIHVYDDDFWEHLFVNKGQVLHKFSSWPDYFAENPEQAAKAKAEWKGDPGALAAHFGLPQEAISRYLVHMPITAPSSQAEPPKRALFSLFRKKASQAPSQPVKAYYDDAFELENFWVFTDFWQRLHIKYPEPVDQGIAEIVNLDANFGRKLPTD